MRIAFLFAFLAATFLGITTARATTFAGMPDTPACAAYFDGYCGASGACTAVCSDNTCTALDGTASPACQACGEDLLYGLEVECWESGVVARAPEQAIVCGDARGDEGTPACFNYDELPGASATLYLAFEACTCGVPWWADGGPVDGPCTAACVGSDPWGDWVCGASWPANADPVNFWTPAQGAACAACVAVHCSSESNACDADGAPPS